MEDVSNVMRQQTQIDMNETAKVVKPESKPLEVEQESVNPQTINSKEDVESLVDELNKAVEPMGTNLKFGVDSDNIFYVSVIDSETSKMIRRFPAEQASDFLPKIQEVSGVLFDSKG